MRSTKSLCFGLLIGGCTLTASPGTAGSEEPAPTVLGLARQLNEAFVSVAETVSPSVVVITVKEKPFPSDDDGLLRYLPHRFREFLDEDEEEDGGRRSRGQGSGIIMRKDGYILTNRHVVEDAEEIRVRLQDGRKYQATIRGVDPLSDVAVIKIEAENLPMARFGDSSKVRVGEFAIAIGAPFSFDYSVTIGHVSAKSRSNVVPMFAGGAAMDQDFIQTDADINPGNSGGPLVNIDGEVVGVNTLIRGLHTGIGFAIPSNLAREVADQLIEHGKFPRAWLGISISSLLDAPESLRSTTGKTRGVVVDSILPDSPAARSDLRLQDVIVAMDGVPVATPQELKNQIRSKSVGHPIALDVCRGSRSLRVTVKPSEWATSVRHRTPVEDEEPEQAALGLTIHPLTPELAERLEIEATSGVLVMRVKEGSAAADHGIQPGDVIASVNNKKVRTPEEFREVIRQADLEDGLLIELVTSETVRRKTLTENLD